MKNIYILGGNGLIGKQIVKLYSTDNVNIFWKRISHTIIESPQSFMIKCLYQNIQVIEIKHYAIMAA